jgi:hypothetical protein
MAGLAALAALVVLLLVHRDRAGAPFGLAGHSAAD